ncbi:hypothetical protein [Hydrogenophaga sp.]|uniref:hypothetical protein n=1 Tax=Hydrogenophaga sp. TaxID=1904254 RepID=UPI0027325AC5|nr:hypothetical protein [Hydrogenophaga sp.]MDP3887533.1 hypothetical protein [Hydrogenophaga sp.]MDZ4356345.1 hypothetical protein [Variovorax sp.]
MKQLAIALALTAAAGSAFAQAATITAVEGLVTVSSGNQLVNATPNMPLASDARVLATANGKATVTFASGCVANLSGGQSISANEDACRAFVLAQQGSGGIFTPVNIGIGAGIGLAVAYNVHQNRKNNTPPTVTPPVQTPPVVVVRPPARPPISRS